MENFERQLADFKLRLKEIHTAQTDRLLRSKIAIEHCNTLLNNFKEQVSYYIFATPTEEIRFFKHIKAYPMSCLIYFAKIRAFEMRFTYVTAEEKKKAINKELKRTHKFFREHFDFVQYVDQDREHLDHLYFTREHHGLLPVSEPLTNFVDPNFTTSHDRLYAHIRANQCFRTYLQNRYSTIDAPENLLGNDMHKKTLRWTASKAALTELVYALYASKVLNLGQTDIKEIAETLQSVFHYELGNFYSTFSEIKDRQKSKTKFLDELSVDLSAYMERFND
jgi:hypothetical protein